MHPDRPAVHQDCPIDHQGRPTGHPGRSGDPRAGTGYGLRVMRERVTALGGTLTVESAPGEGTAVAATLPLPARDVR